MKFEEPAVYFDEEDELFYVWHRHRAIASFVSEEEAEELCEELSVRG